MIGKPPTTELIEQIRAAIASGGPIGDVLQELIDEKEIDNSIVVPIPRTTLFEIELPNLKFEPWTPDATLTAMRHDPDDE
jgi:hypothetical protein